MPESLSLRLDGVRLDILATAANNPYYFAQVCVVLFLVLLYEPANRHAVRLIRTLKQSGKE